MGHTIEEVFNGYELLCEETTFRETVEEVPGKCPFCLDPIG